MLDLTHTISISPISASITGGALCAPGSKTLTASGSDNYTWTPGASTNTTIVVTPSVTTIYTVASTNTLANCVQTFTLAVGVTPSINITGPSTICASTPATLTASGSTTYTWNTGSTSSSITVSPAVTTVYTVSSNSGGCLGVKTHTINTNPLPVISVSPASSTICVPGSPSVALTASGGSTYTWMPGAGLSNTVGTSVNALPSSSTIYTVTGTSSLNCNSTATAAIMVNIGVSITTISANPASICAGNNATLTASATSSVNYCQPAYSIGSGSGDYLSNVMLSTLSNSTGPSPSPYYVLYPQGGTTTTTLTAGSTYSLYIQAGTYGTNAVSAWIDYNQNGNLANTGEKLGEVTGLGASPATATLVFTVPANAGNGSTRLRVREIFNGINHDPCAQATYGETEDYIITIVGGVSALSYTWAPSTFLSSTNTNSTVATAATVTTVYTVTVSNSIGCSNFASTTVSVNSAPTLSVSGSSTICAGQAANISASGATTYTWNTGATTSSIAPTPTANATYTVIGANGACTSNASFTVNVGALPSVSLTAAQATACVNGSTISLTGSPAGGVYTGSNVAGSVFTPGAVAGTFTPSYSFTSTVNGCSKTANVNIVVNPCTGIDSKAIASSELSVYPNPNTGIFTLELNNGAAKTVVVTDLTGRVILTETSTANKLNINISNFANGVYFVKVQSNSTVEVIRVVKH
ncbi:MAG: T9SS type A sorting domain-containing protein [Bacteroidetes bacterium]|nr:T9SS type A sorting domain-containing protein [Bacteroidota bacterium]